MNTAESGSGRRRRLWLVTGLVVVIVLGTAEVAYWAHRWAEDRRQADADRRAQAIVARAGDTKDFGRARAQVAAAHLDLGTLRRAIAGEVHRQTLIRVNGFFDQKSDQQRRIYLDRVIDEASAYQRLMASTRPGAASSRVAQNKATFVAWVTQQPAVTRARLAEFGAAFNARLAQRGLPRIDGPLQ